MEKRFVAAIGRELGSGGKEIGFELSKQLGIKCYDKELLELAAKDSGLCEDIFKLHDEKPTNSFLYSLVMDTYSAGYAAPGFIDVPISQKVFLAQFDTIKKLAQKENCIIVGRCADYALEGEINLASVFISGDTDAKIRRIAERFQLSDAKARDLIVKTDKKRANYYNYYTNKKWGDSASYDLCINSSKLGVKESVSLILEYLKLRKFIEQ